MLKIQNKLLKEVSYDIKDEAKASRDTVKNKLMNKHINA